MKSFRLGLATFTALALVCPMVCAGDEAADMDNAEVLKKLADYDSIFMAGVAVSGTQQANEIIILEAPALKGVKRRWRLSFDGDRVAYHTEITDYPKPKYKDFDKCNVEIDEKKTRSVAIANRQWGYWGDDMSGNHVESLVLWLSPTGEVTEKGYGHTSRQFGPRAVGPNVPKRVLLWAHGRFFSKQLDKVTRVEKSPDGRLVVSALGEQSRGYKGRWELEIEPAAAWMVRTARFYWEGAPKRIYTEMKNEGTVWSGPHCIPEKAVCNYWGPVGDFDAVHLTFEPVVEPFDDKLYVEAHQAVAHNKRLEVVVMDHRVSPTLITEPNKPKPPVVSQAPPASASSTRMWFVITNVVLVLALIGCCFFFRRKPNITPQGATELATTQSKWKLVRKHQWIAVCACVVVGAGAAGLGLRFLSAMVHSRLQMASELDRSDPRYDEVMCGPISLAMALGRVGAYKPPADLASECKVIPQGVALADLERAANATGFVTARARRLNWDELSRLDGVAVLFVKGNHYIAVDPRKESQPGAEADQVRVYDPHRPAEWWTRAKLEGIWEGEALEITRRASVGDDAQGSPSIEWDACYVDQGAVAKGTTLARFEFSFRNVGSSELVIGDIQKSCGCMDHALSQKRLAPGESAVIKMNVNLDDTQGYFTHYAVVETNDARRPASILRMVGGVPRTRVISNDLIALRDLPQGSKVSHQFYAADPGFSGVKIREARFVPHGASGLSEHLKCTISPDLLGEEGWKASSFRFRAMPGDYVVRLEFAASPACPLGQFRGDIEVVLEADRAATTHKVAIEGTIVPDVQPLPRLALITVDSEGAGRATIQLRSHSKRDVAVVRMWSDSPQSLKVGREGEAAGAGDKYTISAQDSRIIAGAAPLQRTAFFELADGSRVSVPVALFRPPQK